MVTCRVICALLGLTVLRVSLAAELPPPAYQAAARTAGIPASVLFAITQQESGLRLRGRFLPWPWTLNVAGQPRRFRTQHAACKGLLQAVARHGAKRIDVGLGQTNLGYQGHHYDEPCDALNPVKNLQVTAQLLREHFQATENWVAAAGRYHRPAGGVSARVYRARFAQRWTVTNEPPVETGGDHWP